MHLPAKAKLLHLHVVSFVQLHEIGKIYPNSPYQKMLQTETRFCHVIHNPVTLAGLNPHHVLQLITEVCIP